MRNRMMLPRIFQSSQQKRETSSAMSKANPQTGGQLVERSAKNHRDHAKLSFSRHPHSPRHKVFRHALRRQHVPGMNQHRRAFVRAVLQERDNSGIVEIVFSHMIADLHAEMAGAHTSA